MSDFHVHIKPILYYPFIAKTIGVKAAIMLGKALQWQEEYSNYQPAPHLRMGWWPRTVKQWEEETGLSIYDQIEARNILVKFSFWKEANSGIPVRYYYHVDFEEYRHFVEAINEQTIRRAK